MPRVLGKALAIGGAALGAGADRPEVERHPESAAVREGDVRDRDREGAEAAAAAELRFVGGRLAARRAAVERRPAERLAQRATGPAARRRRRRRIGDRYRV